VSDALAVLAIYLTLVTLLMTTCFARVESWYARVCEAKEFWVTTQRPNLPLEITRTQRRKVAELRSSMPWGSLLFVVGLIVMFSTFAALIGSEIKSPSFSLWYIWIPGAVAEVAFIGSCVLMMVKGRGIISSIEPE
jgi:hypothetical protein